MAPCTHVTRVLGTRVFRIHGLASGLAMLAGCLTLFALAACGKESPSQPSRPQQPTTPTPPPAPVATRIEISPSAVSFQSIGQTQQLTATVYDQRNAQMTGIPLVWSSGNVRVASIDSNRGVLTARGPGRARITVRSLTLTASIDVTVMQQVVELKIEPAEAVFTALGDSIRAVASAMDQNGHPVEAAVVTWSSSDENVATVSDSGWVSAVGNGSAEVTAESGDVEGTVDVTVKQAVSSVVLEREEAWAVTVGDTIHLAAVVLDRNEHPMVDALVEWSSSDETVVTVSKEGVVTAVGAGSAQVAARSEDAEAISFFVVTMDEVDPELQVLIALYNAMDGPNWSDNTNWLSDEPRDTWHGLGVDHEGRVWSLWLPNNQLSGHIPPELGQLSGLSHLNLYQNQLSDDIPADLGQLENLKLLNLAFNRLTGDIPKELGMLGSLESMYLANNQLTGDIPKELGQLENLTSLDLPNNQITGEIPAELGQLERLNHLNLYNNRLTGGIPAGLAELSNLAYLSLAVNRLTGGIPSELGELHSLEHLFLDSNSFSDKIPPELGRLENLLTLNLWKNRLSGGIPSELGQLSRLTTLDLGANKLEEEIPPALGQLEDLVYLGLPWNDLTGEIPHELGQLKNLEVMNFHNNQLTGAVPESFGGLTRLKKLDLSYNAGLTGGIPASLTALMMLDELQLDLTRLCEPEDSELWDWLDTIADARVHTCLELQVVSSRAILTQSIQDLGLRVPLVAGEEALLRVFISAPAETSMPPMTARFFLNGSLAYVTELQTEGKVIPPLIDVGDLEATANAMIPISVIQPTLEMVIEIDPEGTFEAPVPLPERLPVNGAIRVNVQEIPPMRLTVVPLVWTEEPDEGLLAEVNGLTSGSEYFRPTMTYLPVHELSVSVRDPFWVSEEPVDSNSMLRLTRMIRITDGADSYYLGILYGGGGRGFRPGLDSVSELNGYFIGHELGHNLSLGHSPCGRPTGIDENYPYPEGNIGVWGFDIWSGELVPPFTPDHMSGCGPPDWTSDYTFKKAMDYRLSGEARRPTVSSFTSSGSLSGKSLLIWGGIDEFGELYLEPSFVVDAPPSLPPERGPYRISGSDANGNTLFDMDFAMSEIACGDGDVEMGGFVFAVPLPGDWTGGAASSGSASAGLASGGLASGGLARIELSGPEGFAEMTRDIGLDNGRDGDLSAALLLDDSTGELRGFLRDWPEPGSSLVAARRALPEPGLKVVVSQWVP